MIDIKITYTCDVCGEKELVTRLGFLGAPTPDGWEEFYGETTIHYCGDCRTHYLIKMATKYADVIPKDHDMATIRNSLVPRYNQAMGTKFAKPDFRSGLWLPNRLDYVWKSNPTWYDILRYCRIHAKNFLAEQLISKDNV